METVALTSLGLYNTRLVWGFPENFSHTEADVMVCLTRFPKGLPIQGLGYELKLKEVRPIVHLLRQKGMVRIENEE